MKNENSNNNPFKEIAQLHNVGLNFLIKKLSNKAINGLSREQIIETVCEYLATISVRKSKIERAINYALLSQILNNIERTTIAEKLDALELSSEANKIIKELLSINTEEANEILIKINNLEKKVLNSNFKKRDKHYLQLFISISEASVRYWDKELKKTNSLWHKSMTRIKFIPWKADVNGAIAGAIDPTTDIIFSEPLSGPIIIATKIVGLSISASAYDYSSEAIKIARSNESAKITAERQKRLSELANKKKKRK